MTAGLIDDPDSAIQNAIDGPDPLPVLPSSWKSLTGRFGEERSLEEMQKSVAALKRLAELDRLLEEALKTAEKIEQLEEAPETAE